MELFKKTWVKCILVLTLIAVLSGGLLTILNEVLYVSAAERTDRAIKKIYGEVKEYSTLLDNDVSEKIYTSDKGEITKIYVVGDASADNYDMLFKSTGYNGYKNGTITLWTKVTFTDGEGAITKVILESFTKQTLMSKFNDSFYQGFYVDVTEAYQNGDFSAMAEDKGSQNYNPVSGATYSATASCNAINVVLKCMAERGWESL